MAEDCARHHSDRLYRVGVVSMVRRMRGREVSWVRTPANPEARLHALPITMKSLVRRFGPLFRAGKQVSCDACLNPCRGFQEFDFRAAGGQPVGTVVNASVTDAGEMDVTVQMQPGMFGDVPNDLSCE